MFYPSAKRRARRFPQRGFTQRTLTRRAFTLVELLTVIFIIGLLIAILLPSLSNARLQAKNLQVKSLLNTIEKALEQFRGENEKEFRSTNGYPPSYWDDNTPPGASPAEAAFLGGEDETETGSQRIFGAQWLVRFLMGKDLKGFVPKRNVPSNLLPGGANAGPMDWREKDWYEPYSTNPPPAGAPVDRVGPYLDPATPIKKVFELTSVGAPSQTFFPSFTPGMPTAQTNQPVIIDTFDRPILYYVANPLGKAMCTPGTTAVQNPNTSTYEQGIYRQYDNAGFTGRDANTGTNEIGWNFGAAEAHPIGKFSFMPNEITDGIDLDGPDYAKTFVGYIHAHKVHDVAGQTTTGQQVPGFHHQPVNKDRFILISAGKDGRYGTKDDIKNFERE